VPLCVKPYNSVSLTRVVKHSEPASILLLRDTELYGDNGPITTWAQGVAGSESSRPDRFSQSRLQLVPPPRRATQELPVYNRFPECSRNMR